MPWFWPGNAPEINEMLLAAGDQATSFLDSAAALTTLAGVMGADAASMSSNAASTAPTFVGAGGTAAVAAAAEYTPLSTLASTWLATGSALVGELAAAYQVAHRGMVPAAVAVATRETAEGWTAANWHGFFTPIVNAWWGTYGEQWMQNGAAGEGWESAVYATAGPMAIVPPIAPMMGNPAGVAGEAAMVGEVGAERASSVAMRQSFNGMEKASTTMAGSPMGGMDGMQAFMSMAQMPMSAASALGQPFGQAPQMLGQFPQMGMGLLGPLMSGSALNAASPASQLAAATEAAKQAAATGSMSGPGAGGVGFGGPGSGATAPMSSFSRPPGGGFGSLSSPGPRALAAPGTAAGAPGTSGSMGGGGMLAPHGASERRKGGRAANGEPVSIVFDGERSE